MRISDWSSDVCSSDLCSATASSFPGFARASIHRATRGTRHDRGGSTQPVPYVHPECEAEGLVYRGTEGLPPRSAHVIAQRSQRGGERYVGQQRTFTSSSRAVFSRVVGSESVPPKNTKTR